MKHYPHSGLRIPLSAPCPACGYNWGLVIIRFDGDAGFVRCGRCDSAQYSVAECQQSGEEAV